MVEQMLEFAPDAIVGVGPDGAIVVENAQTEALFGYPRGALLGRQVEVLLPRRYHEVHRLHRQGYFVEPGTRPMGAGLQLYGVREDGTEFPAEISLSSVAIEDDGVIVIASIRDMTDRRDAEQMRSFLAAIVDSSSVAIVGKRIDDTVVSWNAGAERLYGYASAEMVGRSDWATVPEERTIERAEMINDVVRSGRGCHYETVRLHKKGQEVPISMFVSPIRDDRERIIGVAAISHDLSRERAAESRFEQLLEYAPDAIAGVDESGGIVLVNEQMREMFGYSGPDLHGRQLEVVLPSLRSDYEPHAGSASVSVSDERELVGRRRNGTEFPCDLRLSSIMSEGEVLSIAMIRDVTEAKALREEVERARQAKVAEEKAELEAELNQLRRMESVGHLAGGIAHDFNNILGVILNYAQFVAEELGPESPVTADVEEIRAAAERATGLTRQLLIFSRREVVRPRVLDLNALVADLDKLLRRSLGEHVLLETALRAGPAVVQADPGQLEQVLVNLAVNARDAMPGGGRLLIGTDRVELDDELSDGRPGSYIRLSVSDTGGGMSPDVVEKAFDPFYTTKAVGEGTGLGLTTVYGIVSDSNGMIRIYSEPDVGTTIKVDLPAHAGSPAEAVPSDSELPRGASERILVVEDEDGIRRVADRILTMAGYQVELADCPDQALELLARPGGRVDLLMTDVVMPGMLGPELVAKARELRPSLPVLYMSGYIHQIASQVSGAGANGAPFVEKPFTAETLLTAVRDALVKTIG